MGTRITQDSFTRGELSPRLSARTSLEQYAIGLKTAQNALIHQEGGISNRMGLEFCTEVKDSSTFTRTMRFVFNSDQTYMLEFGDKYIRFMTDGGQIIYPDNYGITYSGGYEFTETGTAEDEDEEEYTYYKYLLTDNNEYIYTSEEIAVGTICYADETLTDVYQYGSSAALSEGVVTSLDDDNIGIDEDEDKIALRGEIVEIESPYASDDLPYLKRTQAGDLLTLTHMDYPALNLTRYSHYDWVLEEIVFEPSIDPPEDVAVTWTGSTSSNTRTYEYLVTSVSEDNDEESYRSEVVEVTGHREANWLTTEYMTITWSAVEGASEYNIYRSVNGIFGYLGTAEDTTFTDDCIKPDLTSSAPIARNPFEDDNYPSCSCYYQQRKIYANSEEDPQTLWASQTAAINNFNVSRPLIATDAVTITMDDREVNEIRHLVPMKDLIVLTSNSEWRVNGTDGVFEANPAPAAVIQSCYGSSHVEPIVSGSMVIFVQAGGSVVRDLGYDYLSDAYDGEELSIFSNHLFEGKEIRCMAYIKEPYRIVFVVFTDGTAASMTYNKKQKLCGWTRLETDGSFEWVDTVREGLEDVAYFVIAREINGETVRYIERTKTRIIDNAKDAFLVDSGLAAEFDEPVREVSGFDHLEGKTIVANVNGGIVENLIVEDGTITFDEDVYSIVAGLPYSFEIETLNIKGENTQGLKKIINCVSAKIHNSREDFFFIGSDDTAYQNSRSDDSINDSSLLFSKDIDAVVTAEPTRDATVKIKQDLPLPLTVLSISAVIDVQDNENN